LAAQRTALQPLGRPHVNRGDLNPFYAILKISAALPLGRRPSRLQALVGPACKLKIDGFLFNIFWDGILDFFIWLQMSHSGYIFRLFLF
jgi:hypothetical protein